MILCSTISYPTDLPFVVFFQSHTMQARVISFNFALLRREWWGLRYFEKQELIQRIQYKNIGMGGGMTSPVLLQAAAVAAYAEIVDGFRGAVK